MSRGRLLVALALVAALGLLAKESGNALVRGHLGGTLYVVFWTYLALLARPTWRARRVALAVFLATCAIEAFQLTPWPGRLRGTWFGEVVVGSEYDALDFPFYALGAAIAIRGSRYTGRTKVAAKSTPGDSASTASSQ